MKNNGFTLIELLAVIVILAIIALIATPIILGIINDAREKANERSVELYANAVRNGIAAYQLREGKEVTSGTYNETNKLPFKVEYDGNIVCDTVEVYKNGKIYVEGCKVNGVEVNNTYGTKQELPSTQVFKPNYYTRKGGGFDNNLPDDAKQNATELNIQNQQHYIGFDVDSNNKITTAYVCFKKDNNEYCLKGTDVDEYITNKNILQDAFENMENACSSNEDSISCSFGEEDVDHLSITAYSSGTVETNDGYVVCHVYKISETEWSYECFTT